MLKFIFILPCLLIMFQPLNAKIDPPNYEFRLDTFDDFFPGKSVADLETKFGKGEQMGTDQGVQTLRFYIKKERYKIPVIVQVRENLIEDFFARLPSYFLHDVFFQSIVNRYGKQTLYKKTG